MTNETHIDTEIVIIGGGIAGCIAAISLANTYKITLIDKLETPLDRVGESLAPASQRIFKELQLFGNDTNKNHEKIYLKNLGMQSYWGSDQVHFVDHLKNPDGFVRNLNRKAFEEKLRNETLKKDVNCLWGHKLYSSAYKNKEWEIITKSNHTKDRKTHCIKAQFVIDASGRQAHFAKSIGINRLAFDNLIACWMTVPDHSDNKMSTIIADELGWWYSAVVPNNKRIISFQTDADIVDKNIFKSLASFLHFAKQHSKIKNLIPTTTEDIQFHGTVSANSTRLKQVAGEKWIALGDAAISFDPLSSQGMFNAMANAMQVQKLLKKLDVVKSRNSRDMKTFNTLYTNQIDSIWEHYLKHKQLFYSAETRWKDAVFWNRRH